VKRLRTLSEAECYARCYGDRGMLDTVRVVRIELRRPRHEPAVDGELLRASLEAKLDARAAEAA
jgi:hypothetical protein